MTDTFEAPTGTEEPEDQKEELTPEQEAELARNKEHLELLLASNAEEVKNLTKLQH